MKMIEQAAYIAASRHLKRDAEFGGTLFAALARLDHMDFLLPMKVLEGDSMPASYRGCA